ncbi:Piso0_003358 [Millerozyma farinosa CBS 7064]|uniref:Piso0_003358 protein n=1 Tax=Pichia sorbitophila (strain ATCC MYA-4447 / BCRC 22081 / CBS 7064 / NBRC 10061 / NRRL Y-12695) TaxID=559304 RepID=G8YIV9_PICSO|nr:Piso0_003358 [Millerozyma farinosa CBS 7064]CCE81019.1 Piso0_003358 [Millerozyma farinosa CBS 7064]
MQQPEDEGRKTLYDQLKESKEIKQLEYQKLLEKQNSPYKLDPIAASFYDELKQKELANRKKIQEQEREELSKYRKEKSSMGKDDAKTSSSNEALQAPKKISIPSRKRRKESEKDASVSKKPKEIQEPQCITKKEDEISASAAKDKPYEKKGKNKSEEQSHTVKEETKSPERNPRETKTTSILGDYSSDDDD